MFQQRARVRRDYGAITTEFVPAPEFYYAEDYHQQYLAKNPDGYCGIGGTGVSCPVGVATARETDVDVDLSARTVPYRPALEVIRQPSAAPEGSSSLLNPEPARRRACRRPCSMRPRRSCCNRGASRRGRLRGASPTSSGWTLGREVGWHVRFERRIRARHAPAVATEGILTARLQQDPLLSRLRTIVLDEFHERSIHADLGASRLRNRRARPRRSSAGRHVGDARRRARVASFLGDCPVIEVPGRLHPVESYRAGLLVGRRRARGACRSRGSVLCFLPGAPEIRRARLPNLERARPAASRPAASWLAHAARTGRALDASGRRRVILATNIAETTLTVPDVIGGRGHRPDKVARYDADRGDRQPRDRTDLRGGGGSAGRTRGTHRPAASVGCGTQSDRLRPFRDPRSPASTSPASLLDIAGVGRRSRTFDWFDAPPPIARRGHRAAQQDGRAAWHRTLTRDTGSACSTCRCIPGLPEFSWRPTVTSMPFAPWRCWQSATSGLRARPRPHQTCSRLWTQWAHDA